ncbi:MAG: GEVED domain-containing protein, partial [Luteibaculum sp.]
LNISIPLELEPGFSGGLLGLNRYPEYWRVWIDLNRDGDFEDEDELIADSQRAMRNNFQTNITIPNKGYTGQTRIRVSMKYNAGQTACETFPEGEVEDYSVFLVNGSTTSVEGHSMSSATLFPNPSQGKFEIGGLKAGSYEITVRDLSGKLLIQQNITQQSNQVLTENWPQGVYFVNLSNEQGANKSFRLSVLD